MSAAVHMLAMAGATQLHNMLCHRLICSTAAAQHVGPAAAAQSLPRRVGRRRHGQRCRDEAYSSE